MSVKQVGSGIEMLSSEAVWWFDSAVIGAAVFQPSVASSGGGTVAFASALEATAEDAGDVTLSLTRTCGGSCTDAVEVSWVTVEDGTATAGSDYTSASGTVVFLAGETSETFTVAIIDDLVYEEVTESFSVELSRACDGAVIGAQSSVQVDITGPSDQSAGTLQLSASTLAVSEADGVVSFSVARSVGTNGVVSVEFATTASSAVAGVDFVGTSGTLVFPSGVSTQSFTVPLIGDSVCETTPQTFSDRLMQRASAT